MSDVREALEVALSWLVDERPDKAKQVILEALEALGPEPERLHVLPVQGGHKSNKGCWCEPYQDTKEPSIWIHRENARA